MIWGAARRRARVDAAVAAYTQWRSERDAVRAAYRVWSAAGAFGEPLAFETYQSALDREERAATTYASLMSRVGHLAETGLAHQLARMQALPEAWERDDDHGAGSTAEACDGRRFEPAHGVRSFDTGFMPALPRLALNRRRRWDARPANHRLISASYREVMHAACER